MFDINDEIKLKAVLKSIYRPVRVSPALKAGILCRVLEASSSPSPTLNTRFFLFRSPVWISIMAVAAVILISYGMVMPPA